MPRGVSLLDRPSEEILLGWRWFTPPRRSARRDRQPPASNPKSRPSLRFARFDCNEVSANLAEILTSGPGGVRSFPPYARSDGVHLAEGYSAASPFVPPIFISFPSSRLGTHNPRSSASPSQVQCAIHAALIFGQKRSFENLRSQAGAEDVREFKCLILHCPR